MRIHCWPVLERYENTDEPGVALRFPGPDGNPRVVLDLRRYERTIYENGDIVHVIELKRGQSW